MGFYICEGPNGAGKTTLIKSLANDGYKTLSSPNGTPLAQMLRSACRGTTPWEDIDPRIQFMLFSAARYDEYIRLVRDSNDIVVADRWWTSTFIYQCCLQGIELDFLEYTKCPDEKISKVILLDGDDDVLIQRVVAEREKNPQHGICSWTKDVEKQKKLIHLYREEMPPYLTRRGIPFEIIDTTSRTCDEVKALVVEILRKENEQAK